MRHQRAHKAIDAAMVDALKGVLERSIAF